MFNRQCITMLQLPHSPDDTQQTLQRFLFRATLLHLPHHTLRSASFFLPSLLFFPNPAISSQLPLTAQLFLTILPRSFLTASPLPNHLLCPPTGKTIRFYIPFFILPTFYLCNGPAKLPFSPYAPTQAHRMRYCMQIHCDKL